MLKTEKPALLAALSAVIDAVKANHKNPVLSDFLIERAGDGIAVTGGNLSIEIRSTCAATLDDAFTGFTCPAHRMLDIVKNAPEATIAIEMIGNDQVQIRSGRSKLKLPAMPASDYPKLSASKLPHSVALSSELLAKALSGVAFAAETAVARAHLCGVHVRPMKEGMDLVATSGLILAKRMIQALAFDEDISNLPAITIPNEAIRSIGGLLASGDDVEISFSTQTAVFVVGSTMLTTKLVEGNFPDYRRILPAAESVTAKFNASELDGAVKRVMIATPDSGYGMSFKFSPEAVALSARDNKAGEGEDEVAIEANGEITTGFNGKFVTSAIDHLDEEKLELIVGKDAAPAMIRRMGDDHNYIILMPTRVRAG